MFAACDLFDDVVVLDCVPRSPVGEFPGQLRLIPN